MARLSTVFNNTDEPLAVTGVVLGVASGLMAAGLCALVDPRVVPVGLVIGAILGFIAASAPLFMALRLILLAGVLLVAAAVLGTMVQHTAVIAALVMALVALTTAVWTALPVVGMIFSSLPSLVFILMLAQGQEFTNGAPAVAVAVGGVLGMLPAALLALAKEIWDPRKLDRQMAAALWAPSTPADKRVMFTRVLLMDGAPTTLLHLAAHGSLGVVCRSWIERNSESSADAIAQGDANIGAMAAALLPKGPISPREVTFDTTAMVAPAGADSQLAAAWSMWAASQRLAQRVLAGATPHRIVLRPVLMILGSLTRRLVRPDVSVFRYGVQRALALGIGALALVLSANNENAFWILISLAAVLQANAPTTAEKVMQRSVGTFAGVLLALAVALVLPEWLLVPWIAGAALVVGFAWLLRNYALTALLTGFAVVLLFGAPTDSVAEFAAMRAIDVTIAGILAAFIAHFVMPVRPRPEARRAQLVESLRNLEDSLREGLAEPDLIHVRQLAAKQADVSRAISNLRTDLSLLGDHELVQAYQQDLDAFIGSDEALFALGLSAIDMSHEPDFAEVPMDDALDWVRQAIDVQAAHSPGASPEPAT